MRWFVSRNGETVGPIEEAEIRARPDGQLNGTLLRDEAGGPWMPAEESPFAAYVEATATAAPTISAPSSPGLGIPLLTIIVSASLMFVSCYFVANQAGCGQTQEIR